MVSDEGRQMNVNSKKNILLVCTGNTCRSAMAEGVLKKILIDRGIGQEKWDVSSAGMSAFPGAPATAEAVSAAAEAGVPLGGHRARQVSLSMVTQADIILTMEESHKQRLIQWYHANTGKDISNKTFTLRQYSMGDGWGYGFDGWDIDDPFGGDMETYRACIEEISACLQKAVDKLFD